MIPSNGAFLGLSVRPIFLPLAAINRIYSLVNNGNVCYAGADGGMLGARLKSWMEAQLGRAKKRKQKQSRQSATATSSSGPLPPPHLSSPESAYSTGYSTDGTSPGAPPASLAAPLVAPPPPPAPPTTHLYHEPAKVNMTVSFCLLHATCLASITYEIRCLNVRCFLLNLCRLSIVASIYLRSLNYYVGKCFPTSHQLN